VGVEGHQAKLRERDPEVIDGWTAHLHHRHLELTSQSEVREQLAFSELQKRCHGDVVLY
jgi:hypothetical protein